MGDVAPELRTPFLYVPHSMRNGLRLRVARLVTGRPTRVVAGVRRYERTVPGPAGGSNGTGVRVVVYEPDRRERPSGAVLWIHGGGTVAGRPRQVHRTCSRIARDLGALVVSVDYRLAPEHPFPAGLDDCLAALEWVHAGAAQLGVDPGRVAVGGESAGGGLAASLCQRARDRGGPPIRFQCLVYPMLDDRTVLRADDEGRGTFVWTPASNRFAWTAYLGHPPTASGSERPYAAAARCRDLAGLPPAWIGVGDLDVFLPENVDYARRLEVAGVPCELHVEASMYHGADLVVPDAPSMRAFRARITEALRAGLPT